MTEQPGQWSAQRITRLAARLDRPIVLVGMMGAGKSSVGRRLAAALSTSFADADEEIERAARLTIAELFEQFGEAYFRAGERRVIARLIEEQTGVIATGGGAFAQADTRQIILDRAIAVWIDCDLDTLVERTARRGHRPLLQRGDPRAILARLSEQRQPLYAQAPIRVTSENGPHYRTVERILEALESWI